MQEYYSWGLDWTGACASINQSLAGYLWYGITVVCRKKNEDPSKAALAVEKLQEDLPFARVVYCSVTACTSVNTLSYMSRLGLWVRVGG